MEYDNNKKEENTIHIGSDSSIIILMEFDTQIFSF